MRESFYPDPDAAPLFRTRSTSLRMPDLDAATLTATEAGTLVHLLMQQIDFGKTGCVEDIQTEIDRLRQQKLCRTDAAPLLNLYAGFKGRSERPCRAYHGGQYHRQRHAERD